jgi:hypothetical protein
MREAPGGFSRAELLFDLLLEVVGRYEPMVAAVLRGDRTTSGMPAELLARTLQAQSIWFQLLSIAEQNRDMRNRREVERERGYDQVRGTFANVFAAAAAEGISASEVRRAISDLKVRPVITAHPTEAKRVTVLERHRRIYLRLLELESPRWTDREREEMIEALGEEIELLWLTGELKLQKPTVEQEVAWGLYFFNENLFDVVPQLLGKISRAFAKQFRARNSRFHRSSSSVPGSAGIGTAIPMSRARSPGERCGRHAWRASSATEAACSRWCAVSASRTRRSSCRSHFYERSPRRSRLRRRVKRWRRVIAARSSANSSAA